MNFRTAEGLPDAPAGMRLRSLRFRSCPGSKLEIFVAVDNDATMDRHGVAADSWWVVRCPDLPDRVVRLFRGSHSLGTLLRRYGFSDATGCVHHRDATAYHAPKSAALPDFDLKVPATLRDATGVPQFYPNSGVCWYAALCTTLANGALRNMMMSHLPEDLKPLCDKCLHSREAAEAFRKRLWYDYAVGDNVEDPPEWDGRNGFSEFSVLCAKLGIPIIRFQEHGGKMEPMDGRLTDRRRGRVTLSKPKTLDQPHLLVLRYQDGDHHNRFPILRRIEYHKQRYRLVGLYMGQRKCGHQIGACSPSGDWREWMLGDADLHKDHIGPIFVRFDDAKWRQDWWKAWRELVHVTKFGAGNSEFCSLSPHNEDNRRLDRYRAVGSNSIDVLYTPDHLPAR